MNDNFVSSERTGFSVLHVNIRNITKKFEAFKHFYSTLEDQIIAGGREDIIGVLVVSLYNINRGVGIIVGGLEK